MGRIADPSTGRNGEAIQTTIQDSEREGICMVACKSGLALP